MYGLVARSHVENFVETVLKSRMTPNDSLLPTKHREVCHKPIRGLQLQSLYARSLELKEMSSSSSYVSPAVCSGILDKDWRSKLLALVPRAFENLSQSSYLCDKWLTNESALKLLTQWYAFNNIDGLTERQLNSFLEKHYPCIESSNTRENDSGIFHISHSTVISEMEKTKWFSLLHHQAWEFNDPIPIKPSRS